MAEAAKEPRSGKRYNHGPKIVEKEAAEAGGATPKTETKPETSTPGAEPKRSEDAGTESIPVNEVHAAEHKTTNQRHEKERRDMNARHESELKSMLGRHAKMVGKGGTNP